jgi:predicted HicB family RNase H-like nuclease
MIEQMEYQGYLGSIEVDMKEFFFYGRLLFIRDVVSYQATDLKSLRAAFEEAVEDYLSTCAELGDIPEKPCKGTFNVRIGPVLHQQVALLAVVANVSLNDWVKDACATKALQPGKKHEAKLNEQALGQVRLEATFSDEESIDLELIRK